MYRDVLGRLTKPSGEPWANELIRFNYTAGSYTPTDQYPPTIEKTVTDGDGNFRIRLWCNEEGLKPSSFVCHLPGCDVFEFTLPYDSDADITISELRSRGVQPFPSPPPPKVEQRQQFIPTYGQTRFTLFTTPKYPHLTKLFINGLKALFGTEYVIDASQLTWTGYYVLQPDDYVEIFY
ncbi:MAG: hypothetical protein KME46_25685 [Brasilonema angustatum HA4187-MV1]|jgi:hypothetical protein|nr:hypothetical protein [Brasilonema angustatum HA4187-MV1]